jgi:hypothetical protein
MKKKQTIKNNGSQMEKGRLYKWSGEIGEIKGKGRYIIKVKKML